MKQNLWKPQIKNYVNNVLIVMEKMCTFNSIDRFKKICSNQTHNFNPHFNTYKGKFCISISETEFMYFYVVILCFLNILCFTFVEFIIHTQIMNLHNLMHLHLQDIILSNIVYAVCLW